MNRQRTVLPTPVPAAIPNALVQPRGLVVSSAVSHCGNKLALVVAAQEGERCDIEIIDLVSRRSTLLATKTVIREGKIAWSPDGRTLALTRFGIDLIAVDSGATTRVFGLELGPLDNPTFSADGSRLTVSGAKGFATLDCDTGQVSVRLWQLAPTGSQKVS